MATIALVFPHFNLKIKEFVSALENVYEKIYLFTNEPEIFFDYIKSSSNFSNIQIFKLSKFPSFDFLHQIYFVLKEKIDLIHFHVDKDSELLSLQWMVYISSLKLANQMPLVISSKKVLYPKLIKKIGLSIITVDNRNEYLKFKDKKMKVYLTLPNYHNYLDVLKFESNKMINEDLKALKKNLGSYVLLPELKEEDLNSIDQFTEINYIFYSFNDFSLSAINASNNKKNIFFVKIQSYVDFEYLLRNSWALSFVFNELPFFPLDIHSLSTELNIPIIINPEQEEKYPHLCLNKVTGWVVTPQSWSLWIRNFKELSLENKKISVSKSNTKDDYQNTMSRFYASVLNQKQSWNL